MAVGVLWGIQKSGMKWEAIGKLSVSIVGAFLFRTRLLTAQIIRYGLAACRVMDVWRKFTG